ncbi:hypothetical protein [Serinicoccus marinus]|uniref:hypothetical protein n=1 Tax=Serinicoccus marinus TaxID=247333 RepID=UPI0024909800|nr:hypothetical protein [Serinicoccus marinus]
MHPNWPPTEPFDDRQPWRPVLPRRAEKGFPVAMGIGGLGHPDVMAAMWCRATLEDAHLYYQRARQAAWANWAIERMEDWSPSEAELAGWVQDMWLSGCKLLISAQLAQQWVRTADPAVPQIRGLRVARNSIEHLFEAGFDERYIVASPRIDEKGQSTGAWDLDKLPEGHLLMGLGKDPLSMVFDAIPLRAIVDFAYQHAYRDADVSLDDSTFLVQPPTDP